MLYEGMKSWCKANYNNECPKIMDLRNFLTIKRYKYYNSKKDLLIYHKIKGGDDNLGDMLNELKLSKRIKKLMDLGQI